MHSLLSPSDLPAAEAQVACNHYVLQRLPRLRHATWWLPAPKRDPLIALLAWHLLLQESSDQGRLAGELMGWRAVLSECYARQPKRILARALHPHIHQFQWPEELLLPALEAQAELDRIGSFETRTDLLKQARRQSRGTAWMLLSVVGKRTERCEILADALACALQLIHWLEQMPSCLERGYLPLAIEDLSRYGLNILSLPQESGGPKAQALVASQISWVRELFAKGWPLVQELGPYQGRLLAFVMRQQAARLGAMEASQWSLFAAPRAAGWTRILSCLCMSFATRAAPPFDQRNPR